MIKKITDKTKLSAIAIPAYAVDQTLETLQANEQLTGVGAINKDKLGSFTGISNVTFPTMISWLIGILFTVSAITFFFILISGGIKWLTSGGDEKKVAAARASITSALVGLAIVFASWAIIKLLEGILGISILNFSLRKFYNPALE